MMLRYGNEQQVRITLLDSFGPGGGLTKKEFGGKWGKRIIKIPCNDKAEV